MKNVAIIGGGLAGLACAYTLKRRGIQATVFDSSHRAGGRDSASLFFLAPELFRHTFQLIRDLGLADDVISVSPHAGQVYKGRVHRYRVASATGLLSFKGLNIADKALLPRMAYLLARHSSHLDFHHPERGLEFDKETVASFVKRELSQNILNYIAGPLTSTLFFYGSEETSAWLYLVLAKHMFNTRMSTLRGGLERLTGSLSQHTEIRTGHAIKSVGVDGEAYIVDGSPFADLVIAVTGDAVLSIDGIEKWLGEEDQQFFRQCKYQRTVSAIVATSKPVDGECYAVSIPRVESFAAATICFHDYIDPSRVPDGQGLLTITGGGSDLSASRLLEDLQKLYSVHPIETQISEQISGTPKFPPGRYRELSQFHSRRRRRGLFFCGDYLMSPFVEGAITTGMRVGEAIQI